MRNTSVLGGMWQHRIRLQTEHIVSGKKCSVCPQIGCQRHDRRKNYSFAGKEGKTGRGYYRRQGDSRTLFNPRGNHRFVIRKRQIMEIYCKFAISNTIKETAVQRVNIFQ